jgi:hypothetical protein
MNNARKFKLSIDKLGSKITYISYVHKRIGFDIGNVYLETPDDSWGTRKLRGWFWPFEKSFRLGLK